MAAGSSNYWEGEWGGGRRARGGCGAPSGHGPGTARRDLRRDPSALSRRPAGAGDASPSAMRRRYLLNEPRGPVGPSRGCREGLWVSSRALPSAWGASPAVRVSFPLWVSLPVRTGPSEVRGPRAGPLLSPAPCRSPEAGEAAGERAGPEAGLLQQALHQLQQHP